LAPENEEVFAYIKEYEKKKMLVLLNFTKNTIEFGLPWTVSALAVESYIDNYGDKVEVFNSVAKLRPYEAVALQFS